MSASDATARKRKADEAEEESIEFIKDFSKIIKITLKDGTSKDDLHVHKSLLVKHSRYFRDRTQHLDTIELSDREAHEMVKVYLKCLYTGEKDLRVFARSCSGGGGHEDDGQEAASTICRSLEWFWLAGLALGDINFMNASMNGLLRITANLDMLRAEYFPWLRETPLDHWYIDAVAHAVKGTDVPRMMSLDRGEEHNSDIIRKLTEIRDEKKGRAGPSIHKKAGIRSVEAF